MRAKKKIETVPVYKRITDEKLEECIQRRLSIDSSTISCGITQVAGFGDLYVQLASLGWSLANEGTERIYKAIQSYLRDTLEPGLERGHMFVFSGAASCGEPISPEGFHRWLFDTLENVTDTGSFRNGNSGNYIKLFTWTIGGVWEDEDEDEDRGNGWY